MKFFVCNIGFIANMIANNERYTYEYEDFKTTLTIFFRRFKEPNYTLGGKINIQGSWIPCLQSIYRLIWLYLLSNFINKYESFCTVNLPLHLSLALLTNWQVFLVSSLITQLLVLVNISDQSSSSYECTEPKKQCMSCTEIGLHI